MKFDAIKNLVGAVAPTLGTALGGPLGGAAASAIASVLGCDTDARSLEKALSQATPEQLVQIKKAELEFEARMKELDVDLYALQTADTADARKHFAKDWTARFLAITLCLLFAGYIVLVTILPPDQNSDAIINLILGSITGSFSTVIAFYFGSSQRQD
jgi:hypothetical protein